jgi:DNA (cytosine-5)-methyltransferase 1
MKILNLYAGIGGNRKLWPDGHEITAVEMNENIAAIYKDFFPNDNVIVGDAHTYLLEHYNEYDFIWSSPPCPTHSDIRRCGVHKGQYEALYPDMALYQEIILLQNFARKDSKYCVENVNPYYEPLIKAQCIDRHLFWSNFYINDIKTESSHNSSMKEKQEHKGFNIDKYKIGIRKDKILRNCVYPKLGLHIYNCAFKNVQLSLI